MNAPQPLDKPHRRDTQQWQTQANCRNLTHHMFPSQHKDTQYITTARQICNNCPVKHPCLEHALQYPPADMHGVWAGLTSRQLAAEQRRRGIRPTKPTIAQLWAELAGRRSDGG